MTTETRRAYSQGYQAGVKSQDPAKRKAQIEARCTRLLDLCKTYRLRAERAEAGMGLGQCQQCRAWSRAKSYGLSGPSDCYWGYCGYSEGSIIESDQPWRGEPHQRIATKENFGCIRFEPKT